MPVTYLAVEQHNCTVLLARWRHARALKTPPDGSWVKTVGAVSQVWGVWGGLQAAWGCLRGLKGNYHGFKGGLGCWRGLGELLAGLSWVGGSLGGCGVFGVAVGVSVGIWGSKEEHKGIGGALGVIDLGHCRLSGRGYRGIMGVFGEAVGGNGVYHAFVVVWEGLRELSGSYGGLQLLVGL